MLLCSKCKTPIEDMSDGCKQCKHFKLNLTVRDSSKGDNSVLGDMHEMQKLIRNHRGHLEHVHKMQLKAGADSYDPKLVESIVKLSKAAIDLGKMLRLIQNDTRRAFESMKPEEHVRLLAKVLASRSLEDRKKILELCDDPDIGDTPVLIQYRTGN